MKALAPTLLALLVALAPFASSQAVKTVETYGPIAATQAYNGLGININPQNLWEFEQASAAHISSVRFDCPWSSVEIQNLPQNTSGGYTFPLPCAQGLDRARTYQMRPIVNALYGPPYSAVASGVTTNAVSVGQTSIQVTITSGTLGRVVTGQTELALTNGYISTKHDYSGVLITGINGSVLTLASAATVNIPKGTPIAANLLLYPPVILTQSNYRDNPSIQAFGNYAHFLAQKIAAFGMVGQVAIWNEGPWPDSAWDEGSRLYDNPPKTNSLITGLGLELSMYASTLPLVKNVTFDNGYTQKAGWPGSLYFPNWATNIPASAIVNAAFGTESFHPYGNNPEDIAWDQPCFASYANPVMVSYIQPRCTPTGLQAGSAEKVVMAGNTFPAAGGGVKHSVTETGLCKGCFSPAASDTSVARFELRQFLTFQGLGITPVVFYRMSGDSNFQWCKAQNNCNTVYNAFKTLMTDLQPIANAPANPYSACTMPSVSSYSGYYPLATASFVGAQQNANVNSIMFYTWQRSYTPASAQWPQLYSPLPVSVTVTIPAGMTVENAKDLVTQENVTFSTKFNTVTYPVADNPIELLLVPTTSTYAGNFCT